MFAQGIVHRDIKPENFMFGIKSRVRAPSDHLYLSGTEKNDSGSSFVPD